MRRLFLYSNHVIVLDRNCAPPPPALCYQLTALESCRPGRGTPPGFRRSAIIIARSGAQEISDSCSGSPSIFGVCKLFMSSEGKWMRHWLRVCKRYCRIYQMPRPPPANQPPTTQITILYFILRVKLFQLETHSSHKVFSATPPYVGRWYLLDVLGSLEMRRQCDCQPEQWSVVMWKRFHT